MEKIVLVTGSSSGIGEAIANLLVDKGWTVYASARKPEAVEHLVAKGAKALALDVTSEESVKAAISQIECKSGKLDVLVNNAGYGVTGVFEYINDTKAKQQMDVNVFGLARVTRNALPLLRNANGARIINISSIAGHVSMPLGGWYSASKFAVEALCDSLRGELYAQNIKVISIQPGPITTKFGDVAKEEMVIPEPDGVYDTIVANALKWLDGDFKKDAGGAPIDVANVVCKAIEAKNPKARYRVTKVAKFLVIAKRYMTTRKLDKLFINRMGLK